MLKKKGVDNVIICPKCNTINLANAKECKNCGFIFVKPEGIKKQKPSNIKINEDVFNSQKTTKKEDENSTKKSFLIANKPDHLLKPSDNLIICPVCSTQLKASITRCPKCGYRFKK
jgi:ribosomal protein L40E